MDKKTIEEVEARFEELMNGESFPVDEVISMLSNLPINKAQEWIAKFCAKALDARDFNTLLAIYTNCAGNSNIKFNNIEVRDSLKKSTADRTLLSFVDAVRFDARDIRDSLNRLNSLISFTPGKLVFCDAWGLGEIKRIDSFYRKLTVDFRTRKGHQFAFDAACEMLTFPKEDHILVVAYKDSAKIESMKKDAPGELVKAFLSCFGNMPVSRLEELISLYGLVSASEWKNFWDKSFISLPDESDYWENLWYLNLYYANSQMRGKYPAHFCNGIWGFYHDFVPWNHFFHYNMQLATFPLEAAGHSELLETYYNFRFNQLPEAKEFARLVHNKNGAFYTDVCDRLGRNDMQTVHNCTCSPQLAMMLYNHYLYSLDKNYLYEKALPLMKATGEFYLDMLTMGDDGYYHIKKGLKRLRPTDTQICTTMNLRTVNIQEVSARVLMQKVMRCST